MGHQRVCLYYLLLSDSMSDSRSLFHGRTQQESVYQSGSGPSEAIDMLILDFLASRKTDK